MRAIILGSFIKTSKCYPVLSLTEFFMPALGSFFWFSVLGSFLYIISSREVFSIFVYVWEKM